MWQPAGRGLTNCVKMPSTVTKPRRAFPFGRAMSTSNPAFIIPRDWIQNKNHRLHPPRRLGTFPVRGEGGLEVWAADIGGRMKDCFNEAVLFSLRQGRRTAILEENNRF